MRRILIGFALALIALPAWAQSEAEMNWWKCSGDDPDFVIAGCSALIQSNLNSTSNHLVNTYANLLDEHYNRGNAYIQKGFYDEAIADFTQVIVLKPDLAAPYNQRAWAYHLKGQDAKGLPDANRAIALAPNNGGTIETRAEIYEKLGQHDNAIADYRAALKLNPNDKDSQTGLKRLGATP